MKHTLKIGNNLCQQMNLIFESNITKCADKISIENYSFVSKSLNNQLPKAFNIGFDFSSDTHRYEASFTK